MLRSIRPKHPVPLSLARTIASCAAVRIVQRGRVKWAPGIGSTGDCRYWPGDLLHSVTASGLISRAGAGDSLTVPGLRGESDHTVTA
jgi:hypothetical protein